MSPWIQVYADLPSHRKIYKLSDCLRLKTTYEAVGLIVSLWCWAAVNATDGNITEYPERAIAAAAGWQKNQTKLVEALVSSGFLDRGDDGTVRIHDWDEHAMLLMDSAARQREKCNERVRKHREKKRAVSCNASNGKCNVTVTPSNAPTKPNLTIPLPVFSSDEENTPPTPCGDGETRRNEFVAFWDAYPTTRGGMKTARKAWDALNLDEPAARRILDALEIFKQSTQWTKDDGNFIPSAAKFLRERQFEKPPVLSRKDIPKGASGSLGAAEMEAIQRVLDEDELLAIQRMMKGVGE